MSDAAIDVEAVCAEWRRLGGSTAPKDGEMVLLCNGAVAATMYDSGRAYVWFGPGVDIGDVKAVSDIMATLPKLARAWGLTKERAVLTWDEAAALWVEWGGVAVGPWGADEIRPPVSGLSGPREATGLSIENDGSVGWWFDGDIKASIARHLTADTLEEMAEACGLPMTPAMVERVAKAPRYKHRDPSMMAKGAADNLVQAPSKPEPKAVDQWAEKHSEYNARLDAFMGAVMGKADWERVHGGFHDEEVTYRLEVPGGWLYRFERYQHDRYTDTLVFAVAGARQERQGNASGRGGDRCDEGGAGGIASHGCPSCIGTWKTGSERWGDTRCVESIQK